MQINQIDDFILCIHSLKRKENSLTETANELSPLYKVNLCNKSFSFCLYKTYACMYVSIIYFHMMLLL